MRVLIFSKLFVINRIKDIQDAFYFLTCGYRWNWSQKTCMLIFMYVIWRPLYPTLWTCCDESKTVFGGPTTNPLRKRDATTCSLFSEHFLMKVKLNLGVQFLIPLAKFMTLHTALWICFDESKTEFWGPTTNPPRKHDPTTCCTLNNFAEIFLKRSICNCNDNQL